MGELRRKLEGMSALEAARFRATLSAGDQFRLDGSWSVFGRDSQQPPKGDWRVWLLMAGRGFGKTRTGAEWVRGIAEADGNARIALLGATMAEARSVMVEGPSGVLAVSPPALRPDWEPSLKRLRWPNGAMALLYSAAEPEQLRGPEHDFAWADEIAKWPQGEHAWDNLMLGLRRGASPRVVATTTPRPVPLLRTLITQDGVVVTRGRSEENAAHLPEAWLAAMRETYGGTRLGRQELDGELIAEAEGALWTRDLIERCRERKTPVLRRIVVAVDPPAGIGRDACGIVVAALGADGRGYVLEDATVHGLTPMGWARAVSHAAAAHGADRVVAEANNGGAMVEATLRAVDARLPVKPVHATRGKSARAEPVAALYAAGKVRHVGGFAELEDQMCGMLAAGGYEGPGRSPDRADALVWAITELMLGRYGRPAVRRL